jgi:transcriptional regulator with XRE-family HTH domain
LAEARQSAAQVGARVRLLRLRRRATLRSVAERAGLSQGFLSQVERGHAVPSIVSLQRIAGALGVSVYDLFAPDESPPPRVLRRAQRPELSFEELRLRKFLIAPRPLENLEVIVGEIEPGGASATELYTHGDSEELFLVVAGQVEVEIDGERHTLSAGDSIDYRSSLPHVAWNRGEERAEVIWIISPPSGT